MNNKHHYRRFLTIAILFGILAVSVKWWLPYLLSLIGFIDVNSNAIQGISDTIQLCIWIIGGVFFALQWAGIVRRDATKQGSIEEKAPINTIGEGATYTTNATYIGAVGQGNKVETTIYENPKKDNK